jgi:hypothetical protein
LPTRIVNERVPLRPHTSTERDMLVAVGERPEPVGAHDRYEPTVVSRVYFILDAPACQIKIGYAHTGDVAGRLAAHERKRGRKLDLLGSLPGGYDLERAMHGRFRDYRREAREWYSSEIIGEVAGLLAARL